eukprot:COSAG04_NODE_3174_length_3090_cov_1.916750_4_plen_151_part_00
MPLGENCCREWPGKVVACGEWDPPRAGAATESANNENAAAWPADPPAAGAQFLTFMEGRGDGGGELGITFLLVLAGVTFVVSVAVCVLCWLGWWAEPDRPPQATPAAAATATHCQTRGLRMNHTPEPLQHTVAAPAHRGRSSTPCYGVPP